jgi:glycosyltransferase involved in cell wall biosynthesis
LNIVFVINSFAAGGAERVATALIEHLNAELGSVTAITSFGPEFDAYALPKDVRRISLRAPCSRVGFRRPVLERFGRLLRLRRVLRQVSPDVIISFGDETNVAVLVATLGTTFPVVVSERVDPRYHRIAFVWRFLRRALYRNASAVVVQTEGLRPWAATMAAPARVHVIPNPVILKPSGDRQADGRRVLAIGRLNAQKRFDLLLRSFAAVRPTHPTWTLVIRGEGSERAALEQLVRELGLEKCASLPGLTNDVGAALAKADLFVLSSDYEGFPNALLEAMASGVAVISTDCPSGPADIVRDGVDGLLVPRNDLAALTRAMDRLMTDQPARQRLGAAARDVAERFSTDRVFRMWDDLIKDVTSK